MKLHKCIYCNTVAKIINEDLPISCCGKKMIELTTNTNDGVHEKHIPVYVIENDNINITVGSNTHPMDDEHYITLIAVEHDGVVQEKYLTSKDSPTMTCKYVSGSKIYAYCNTHGLYETTVK